MRIYLIYGPQGCGKSTQARKLAEKLNLVLISAGEISREIAAQNTEEGKRVKELIDRGEPTPEEIIVPAVERKLDNLGGAQGFVFDGYPRYAQQIEPLVVALEKHGWEVGKAILIKLSEEESRRRIMARVAGGERTDDTPESIARRLQLYHEQTEPIINYFRKMGKLVEVDGSGTIEEVHNLITKALND